MARMEVDGKFLDFPEITGSENEKAIDISKLRSESGYITLDDSFGNTGSCRSAITYIDGANGILRYRGYSIEELAEKSSFIETAYLVIYGHLPNREEYDRFSDLLTAHEMLDEDYRKHYEGFPRKAHPMAILSAMINTLGCYDPEHFLDEDVSHFDINAARLISQVRTVAAAAYRMSVGQPMMYPSPDRLYANNFLHMMFSQPYKLFEATPEATQALNKFWILHADHEQNCSTSTVRLVASSGANMYASCAAGVCALWGKLHGGANQAVVEMLLKIQESGISVKDFVDKVKRKEPGLKLMGFGHRVYKNFDPRSKILQKALQKMLKVSGKTDPLLDIAQELEECALRDEYFIERKLYPNVDFYSGLILRNIGIPLNMFTVMFAIGRMPGWIAHWKEISENPKQRIYRPRQIYTGENLRSYIPLDER